MFKRMWTPSALAVSVLLAVGVPQLSAADAADAAAQASTQEKTATFAIENMTCALCPVTVKKAMEGVRGVKSVKVDFKAKTATVVYDASLATPEEIAAASTNAGYPATPTA